MFKVFSDEKRNLVTFITDNINEDFLSHKEIEYGVNKYDKLEPIPERFDSNKEEWVIIYYKKD